MTHLHSSRTAKSLGRTVASCSQSPASPPVNGLEVSAHGSLTSKVYSPKSSFSAPSLTIIFGYRNREPARVARCLASLAGQTRRDFVVLFVDYGSSLEQARAVRAVVEQFPFARYIYTDTRGWPWNRSHALNIGIRQVETLYILTSDIDIVFPEQFVEVLLSLQDGNAIVHCAPVLLPKGVLIGSQLSAQQIRDCSTTHAHRGVCQCFPASIAMTIHGFDEVYRVWGREDEDFAQRLMRRGLTELWIEDRTSLFHVWHPIDRKRIAGLEWALLWARMALHYEMNRNVIIRNDSSWGKLITTEARVVFEYVDPIKLRSRECAAEKMSFYRYDPNDSDAFTGLFESLFSLKKGQALVVAGASFPKDNKLKRLCVKWVNRGLESLGVGVRFESPVNYLHPFLNDFVMSHPEIVADYYCSCGLHSDDTVIVRA